MKNKHYKYENDLKIPEKTSEKPNIMIIINKMICIFFKEKDLNENEDIE